MPFAGAAALPFAFALPFAGAAALPLAEGFVRGAATFSALPALSLRFAGGVASWESSRAAFFPVFYPSSPRAPQ